MKYRIYCPICNENKIVESLIITTKCPNNSEHICDKQNAVVINTKHGDKSDPLAKDYKRLRAELIEYVVASSGNLPTDELAGAAEHFCLPKELRDIFYTVEQQIQFGYSFHNNSTDSRTERANKVMVEMYNHLSLNDAFIVGQSVRDKVDEYIRYGLEGTTEGDVEGIFDFFLATSGTTYETTGFPTLTGINIITDITVTGLADVCYKLLKYGTKDV